MSYGNNGRNIQGDARSKVTNYLNSNGPPNSIVSATVSFPQSYYCSTSGGSRVTDGQTISSSRWDQTQLANGYRFAFTATDAPDVQRQRLLNAESSNPNYVPDQYSFKICSAGAPAPNGIDLNNRRATINCSATGRALYNWTTAMEQTLASEIKGISQSAALAKLQSSATGYDPNSVQIHITNGTYLPKNPSQIQVIVQDPA